MKDLKWETKGINIDGNYLSNLRFADDIVIFARTPQILEEMLRELSIASENIGLHLNPFKTKISTNSIKSPIVVNQTPIEYTEEYIYLGKQISLKSSRHKDEIDRRINMAWRKFWSCKEILKSKLSLRLKKKILDSNILPCLLYGSQTWLFNTYTVSKIRSCQRAMERSILGIQLIDKQKSQTIRQKTKIIDAIHQAQRLKWKWAGHMGLKSLCEVYGSLDDVIIVTLAPELPGALDAIKGLTSLGIKVALGHSTANLADGEKAVKCGANLITHLFNAMLPFHHRDPGLVGLLATTTEKQVFYGIISDGIHTHPAALRIACRTNSDGLILVSDAVAAQGLPDGTYSIGPMSVSVENGRAYVVGTKTLCGSTTALDECIIKFKEATDCSLEYALETASLHPAKALGIEHIKGNLNYGCDADFVIMDPKTLKVLSTWIAGECVYTATK